MATKVTQSITLKELRRRNRTNTNPPPTTDGNADPIVPGIDDAFNGTVPGGSITDPLSNIEFISTHFGRRAAAGNINNLLFR